MEQEVPAHEAATVYLRSEGVGLAIAVMAVSLLVGYDLVFRLHQVYGDAMSRVLTGLYITWGGQFHLAAMSFYWSPLISLLSIPFALVRHVWPPLMTYGFTANILSASFAAVGAYHINRLFWRFGLPAWARVALTLLYAFNPLILLYSGNGMSDQMECALVIASAENMVAYLQTGRLTDITKAGSWLAAAFMVRYESVPIGAGMGMGLTLAVWRYERNWQKANAVAIAFLLPVFAAGIIWILLGWMIMHDPLYFLNSRYSNGAQIASGTYNFPQVMAARHNIGITLYQVVFFSVNFIPYFPALIAVAVMQLRRRPDPIGLPLILGSLGAPLLQVALLYTHRSADWQRFFIYYVPFGVMLCGYLLWRVRRPWRFAALAGACVLFLFADYVTLQAMRSRVWGNGDTTPTALVLGTHRVKTFHTVNDYSSIYSGQVEGAYVNAHPGLRVLVSTFQSWPMMAYIHDPKQVIFSNQMDFRSVLLNPRGRANAILTVPDNSFSKQNDTINAVYPALWSGRVGWTKLIHQFPNGDRVFAILPTAP